MLDMALRKWWDNLTGKNREPMAERGFRDADDAARSAAPITDAENIPETVTETDTGESASRDDEDNNNPVAD